jgi:hypothetical protein
MDENAPIFAGVNYCIVDKFQLSPYLFAKNVQITYNRIEGDC